MTTLVIVIFILTVLIAFGVGYASGQDSILYRKDDDR